MNLSGPSKISGYRKVTFRLGAPHPQRRHRPLRCWMDIIEPQGGQLPTEAVWQISEPFPRYSGSKFGPHNVTANEVSAHLKCHTVEVVGGYNVLMFRDDSIEAARVIRDSSFRISPYQKNARSEYGPIYACPSKKKYGRRSQKKLLHPLCDRTRCLNACAPSFGGITQFLSNSAYRHTDSDHAESVSFLHLVHFGTCDV